MSCRKKISDALSVRNKECRDNPENTAIPSNRPPCLISLNGKKKGRFPRENRMFCVIRGFRSDAVYIIAPARETTGKSWKSSPVKRPAVKTEFWGPSKEIRCLKWLRLVSLVRIRSAGMPFRSRTRVGTSPLPIDTVAEKSGSLPHAARALWERLGRLEAGRRPDAPAEGPTPVDRRSPVASAPGTPPSASCDTAGCLAPPRSTSHP